MSTARLITEERLDEWVRANYRDAQSVIVELISRLISASCPWPKNKRFPIGGGIGQHGPDGILKVDLSYEPFVPTGVTYWQIGSSLDAHRKATKDYNELTKETPKSVRLESTFIFVTPLSGRRDWECTWKKEAQLSWLKEHREENQWKDIRIIDGTVLVDWLSNFLPVELWLAKIINGLPTEKIVALDIHWEIMKTIGEPPQLDSSVFLIGREKACSKLKELFDDKITTLRLITPYPDQVVDFVAAYLARADLEERIGIVGRCLAISGVDAWNSVCTQYRNYFLVAMPDLDLSGNSDLMLLVKARAAGHRVIYGCTSAGAQDCNIADLPQPSPHQLSKTLETVGYDKERAFSVAKNCSGNLSNFLKIIQGLPLSITCATESDSSTLSIALLLGSWNEKNNEDRKIIEKIAQKPYNDWIEKARHLLHSPNSPLRYGDGIWEFVDKRTGWESLGCNIFDDYLELFQKIVVTVLREKDPKFDLPSEEQFMAQVRGKILSHSDELRTGLVESLAIMGSNPQWLTSASTNIVQKTTNISVRNVLDEADGILWASLNDILPMLAEAAPSVFISQVQLALKKKPSPFDSVYAQESSGLFGSTYITGLLWALETLAWDPDHIVTVISVLGELATHDPGGNWKNRPKNSITAILLPWLPQTCASIEKRLVAVKILLRDYPDVGWEILLTLLPKHHSVSEYTRKPTWMRIIPNDWSQHVSFEEYWKQTNNYSDLAVRIALNNNHWLVEIVDSLDDLPINYRGALLQYLESEAFINRPEEVRSRVWDALVKLINRHRVYSDAEWALNCEAIDEIQKVADRIAPKSPQKLFARLFNDNDLDLFTRKGDFQDQERDLETERETGIREIFRNNKSSC